MQSGWKFTGSGRGELNPGARNEPTATGNGCRLRASRFCRNIQRQNSAVCYTTSGIATNILLSFINTSPNSVHYVDKGIRNICWIPMEGLWKLHSKMQCLMNWKPWFFGCLTARWALAKLVHPRERIRPQSFRYCFEFFGIGEAREDHKHNSLKLHKF